MKKITNENYFLPEISQIYTGSSEIKSMIQCEAATLAKLRGEWIEETTTALKQSSYVDAWASQELEQFKEDNPDMFLKSGELKAEYRICDNIIEQIKEDPMFLKYITAGENQKIMTGTISNVPVKIKIDCLHADKLITDLKVIKDLSLIWNEKTHQKENFIDFYDYVLQAALYREIVKQNTGKELPFIIAVATKNKYSERALLQIPTEKMDLKLDFLKEYLPHLQALKEGKIEPTSCGKCPYCISKKKTERIYYYDDFFNKED